MDIDKALLQVGGMRPYHWLLFSLVNTCIFVPIAANAMYYVFIAWTPRHHCSPAPGNETSNTSYSFNATLPQCFEQTYGQNVSRPCQHGWVYDMDPLSEQSIVTEWDLVCNYDYLAEMGETLSGVASCLGLFMITPLTDKYGRKPIFFICMLIYIVLGVAMAFSPSVTAYYALRFFLSFFDTFTCIGLIIVMELYSTKHRAFAGVGLEFYWLLAYFYLAMLMYFVRLWRYFILIVVIPWVAFIGLYWLLPESAPWLLSVGRKDEAIKVLKFLAKRNCVEWSPPEECELNGLPEEDEPKKEMRFVEQLIMLVKDPILRRHTIMNCLYWFANYNVYMGIILTSPSLAGDKYLSFTLGGVVEVPAYVLCMVVVRYGRRISTMVFHVLAGLCLLIAALLIGLDLGGEHQRIILLIVTLLGKFGITSSFAVIFLYTIELFPTNLRGTGSSFGRIFGRIGSLGSPFLAYWLKYNKWLPLIFMGVLSLVTGCATFVLPETCDKKMPQSLQDVYGLYDKTYKSVPLDENSETIGKQESSRIKR